MLRIEPLTLNDESRALYEEFVPEHHPLRRMDEALDFSFILDLVKDRYNPWIGCPAKHPEQMWRLLYAQYYMNLSDEKICLMACESTALRLFLRLERREKPPHPTTLQKFRFNRLTEATYLEIHFALLEQAGAKGVLDPSEREIWDSSHMRSNTRVVSIALLLLQARGKVLKEVQRIDPTFAAELWEQAGKDKEAYKAERERRRKAGEPKLTKEEKVALASEAVSRTWIAVGKRIASGQLEPTERLNLWLAVLEKVIHDREKGATERIVSVHDLEARKGRKAIGAWDGRKLAITMQEESRLITAAVVVSGNVNDCQVVAPTVEQRAEGLGHMPPELTVDKGADTGPVREYLLMHGVQAHIPVSDTNNNQGGDLFTVDDFTYYPRLQILICPAGKTAYSVKRDIAQWRDGYVFYFRMSWCQSCALRGKCQKQETKRTGRSVYIGYHWALNKAAERHMQTPEFQIAYGKRARVEAKISEVVYHGGRRCRYRGDARSRVQLWITVIAVNGKRLTKLLAWKRADDPGSEAKPVLQAA